MSKHFSIAEVEDGFVCDAAGIAPKGSYRTIANDLHEVAAKMCLAFLGKHYPNAKIVVPVAVGPNSDEVWIDVLTSQPVTSL